MYIAILSFANRLDEMSKWGSKSIICVRLQTGHRILGVIQLINTPFEDLGENEMIFLHALCDYAAIAIAYKRGQSI
jgi:GAF domain-containing protein